MSNVASIYTPVIKRDYGKSAVEFDASPIQTLHLVRGCSQ